MKSNYVVRAQKFLREFIPYMRMYPISVAVNIYNQEKHRKVMYRHGAVRRALITSDYVIKWDYDAENRHNFGGCREEYKKYLEVKDDYYGYLFAEITPVKVKGRQFYVMPRVKIAGEYCSNTYIEDVLNEDELDFIFDDARIGDVHENNWGMLHGKPVLIDYACPIMC